MATGSERSEQSQKGSQSMKTSCLFSFLFTVLIVGANLLRADNWPQWRGPKGTGISAEKDLPIKWSSNDNVRWRAELPGPGNASPIAWGDRVFITQAVQSDN